MFIDSHCHLNYPGLVEQQEDVVTRAFAAGLDAMISISTRRDEWEAVVKGAEKHDRVFATVGVHPHEADTHQHLEIGQIVAATRSAKVVGIGETGLDYHYGLSTKAGQLANFQRHIAAAQETGLPLVIHTRDAEEETIRLLKEELGRAKFPFLIHCFTGSQHLADACLGMGGYISLSGILTFRSARALQETAKTIPLNRLLVETDSPFLAPVPMRGKTCEPAFVMHTARFLAELREIPLEELGAATERNTRKLFSKMAG